MDYEFWEKFYDGWDQNQLIAEIDTCHLYQQNCLRQVGTNQSTWQYQLKQLMQSQERVKVLVQVIRKQLIETLVLEDNDIGRLADNG